VKISFHSSSTDSLRICQMGEGISLYPPFAQHNTGDFLKMPKMGAKKTGNLFLISCLGEPFLYSGGYSIFSMFATTLQAKSWQIYKSFSSYGLFQEPISMIFPSGSAIKQVRCPHGLVVGSNKDVAPCATAF